MIDIFEYVPPAVACDPSEEEMTPEQVIEALDANLTAFERLVEDRTREELAQPAQDGGWGVVDILSHLQDWERITHDRVWRILAEDDPHLEEHDDSFWAIDHEYGARDGHEVLGSIIEMRQQLIERMHDLDPAEWERTGILEGRGSVTVAWLLRKLVQHDANNLARMREALG